MRDPEARLYVRMHDKHARFLLEKRGVVTSGLGGVVPPAYLADQWARAPRTGRVYCDQANRAVPLPAEGLTVTFPRLTAGATAGVQNPESTALATQGPTEGDLTVPVRTLGGYLPVSRQALDRSLYSDQVLFEDLVARYQVALDTQCLSGLGTG